MEPTETKSQPDVPLWRSRNFLTFWTGQAFSQFGAELAGLAIPVVAVLLLSASEWEVGLLGAAASLAFLLVGLPSGAWIDRLRKRRVMIIADLIRAVALLAIPLLWWLNLLHIWHLYAVALVIGAATVFFDVSYQSLIPALVQPREIASANGKLESTAQLAGIVGPAAGGSLIAIISAPLTILITAGTYLLSMFALTKVHDSEEIERTPEYPPLWESVKEGLTFVLGHPLLSRIVATTAISNFFNTLVFTMVPIILLRELGYSPELMGFVLSTWAVGGFLGAVLTPTLVKVLGEGTAIPVSAVIFVSTPALMALALMFKDQALWLLVLHGVLSGFAVLTYNISQVSFRQRITPTKMLGRMNASIRFLVWGVMPIAAVLSGWLADSIGLLNLIWIAVVGGMLSALPVVLSPLLRMRELPES